MTGCIARAKLPDSQSGYSKDSGGNHELLHDKLAEQASGLPWVFSLHPILELSSLDLGANGLGTSPAAFVETDLQARRIRVPAFVFSILFLPNVWVVTLT